MGYTVDLLCPICSKKHKFFVGGLGKIPDTIECDICGTKFTPQELMAAAGIRHDPIDDYTDIAAENAKLKEENKLLKDSINTIGKLIESITQLKGGDN